MTDEEKKRIVSEPPPPTDEIDDEWGDDDQTLVRELPEGVVKSQPAPPSEAVGKTAVAPISVPAPAAKAEPKEEDDEEEDDEEEDDEEEESTNNEDDEEDDDDDDDGASAEPAHAAPAPAADWIPEWAPLAVLGLLVTGSILIGLGLIGGSDAHDEGHEGDAAPAASVVAPAKKPSPHP